MGQNGSGKVWPNKEAALGTQVGEVTCTPLLPTALPPSAWMLGSLWSLFVFPPQFRLFPWAAQISLFLTSLGAGLPWQLQLWGSECGSDF